MQFSNDGMPTAPVKAGDVPRLYTTAGMAGLAAMAIIAAGIGSMAGSTAAIAMNMRDAGGSKKSKKSKE